VPWDIIEEFCANKNKKEPRASTINEPQKWIISEIWEDLQKRTECSVHPDSLPNKTNIDTF
jgi:hypothetical protein